MVGGKRRPRTCVVALALLQVTSGLRLATWRSNRLDTTLPPYGVSPLHARIGFAGDDDGASLAPENSPRQGSSLQGGILLSGQGPNDGDAVKVDAAVPGKIWRSTPALRALATPLIVVSKGLGFFRDAVYMAADLPGAVAEAKADYEAGQAAKQRDAREREREAARAAETTSAARMQARSKLVQSIESLTGTVEAVQKAPQTIQATVAGARESVEATITTVKETPQRVAGAANRVVDTVVYAPLRFFDGVRAAITRTQNAAKKVGYVARSAVGTKTAAPAYKAAPAPRAPPSFREKMKREAQLVKEAEYAAKTRSQLGSVRSVAATGFTSVLRSATVLLEAPVALATSVQQTKADWKRGQDRVAEAVAVQEKKSKEARQRLADRKEAALEAEKVARKEAEKAAEAAAKLNEKTEASGKKKASLEPKGAEGKGKVAGEGETRPAASEASDSGLADYEILDPSASAGVRVGKKAQ